MRQVITALRKDAQQRTAKTQRYADYLHQRSLFVQEKDRYQKDPNGLHGVEDGTGNRSRLTDAQQIAEHEPVESELPRQNSPIRCRLVTGASFTNQLVIQNATAAKTQRTVTPVNAPSHKGSRNFNPFIFNPAMTRDATILRLASSFLSFISFVFFPSNNSLL